jgi:uncharacterized protein (DUF4415 family)
MTESKRATRPPSKIGSDLQKVDTHVITPEEYEEAPELTDEMLARATLHEGGKPVRRGRPPIGGVSKRQVTLRLSADVLEHFKAAGPGWQTRIDEALRDVVSHGRQRGSKVG